MPWVAGSSSVGRGGCKSLLLLLLFDFLSAVNHRMIHVALVDLAVQMDDPLLEAVEVFMEPLWTISSMVV